MNDILYTAFISPALHATLLAWKSEPKPTRKTAQQRRVDTIMKRHQQRQDAILQERDDREVAFQRRVTAVYDAIYHEFQPYPRCVLSNEPTLTDEQRRTYALQAQVVSGGTASRRKLKRELKDMRRKQRREGLSA